MCIRIIQWNDYSVEYTVLTIVQHISILMYLIRLMYVLYGLLLKIVYTLNEHDLLTVTTDKQKLEWKLKM